MFGGIGNCLRSATIAGFKVLQLVNILFHFESHKHVPVGNGIKEMCYSIKWQNSDIEDWIIFVPEKSCYMSSLICLFIIFMYKNRLIAEPVKTLRIQDIRRVIPTQGVQDP